ncbi:ABC transporter ATP-binding protein [Micromonosporaceae bacterium B7E4]
MVGALLGGVFAMAQRLVRLMAGVSLPARRPVEVAAERLRLARLVALAGRGPLAALIAGHALAAIAPVASAVTIGWLVGRLSAGPDGIAQLAAPLAVFAAIVVIGSAGELAASSAGQIAGRQIDHQVRRQVRQLALAPAGISHLEDASYQDELRRASDLGLTFRTRSPGTAATGQVTLLFRMAGALAAAALLARFSVSLAAALILVSLLMRAIVRTQWLAVTELGDRFTPQQRQVDYWTDLAASASAAKEVRLFGLGRWVPARRLAAERAWIEEMWATKDVVYGRQTWVGTLAAAGAAAALIVPAIAVADGTLGVDGLAMYAAAAWGIFEISYMGDEAFDIEYGAGAVRALDRLRAYAEAPGPAGSSAARPVPTAPPPARRTGPPLVRFDEVTFRYTGAEAPVLDGLHLEIRPGEVLGVVGVNGAGKTTMMKLLAGLYQPTGGRITVDGTDLAGTDLDRWRQRLAVLFQDFVHYPLSAEHNVALGAGDRPTDGTAVRDALREAGAAGLVDGLAEGGRTLLSRSRTGGAELSGGQWQRVALARVLYAVRHGRDLVVLDEPTAHLDVRAEAVFFDQVVRAVAGSTVLLISHRLSTVRRADRIVLLDAGRVAEVGSHDELMAGGGAYARLFRLQAARFGTDATSTAPPPRVSAEPDRGAR